MAAWINLAQTRPLPGNGADGGAEVFYVGVACWIYVAHRFVLPLVLPLVFSGAVTHTLALIYRVRVEQSEKKRVKSVFTKMLAPEVVEELLDAKNMALGGRGAGRLPFILRMCAGSRL